MKQFWNRCVRHHENICLLAGGALSDPERGAVEKHLAECADCWRYYTEITGVAAPLSGWKKDFAAIEPCEAARSRWTRNILAAAKPEPAAESPSLGGFLGWWREVIWPCRRAWVGMASVWLLMWVINAKVAAPPKEALSARTRPTPAMFQAYAEERRLLTELIPPANSQPHAPPPPANPRPRSEGRNAWRIA